MLNISAFLLSQKRLNEVLSSAVLPAAARLFTITDAKNAGLHRTAVISAYETAALAWLSERKFPSLGQLITESRLAPGLFFIHDGPFFGREIKDSAVQFQEKGYTSRKPVLWTKLETFREGLKLTVQAHPENYTTKSAPGEMAGKNHLFLAGRITELEEGEIRAQAYIVGRLHEELRPEAPSIDRFNRLPWKMEVFPVQIDQFAAGAMETTPTTRELALLKRIPEDRVKNAFAELLGEPFVPRDWGGERSDLVTSNLSIEGERIVAAFAFKGKSVPRPLTIADMGLNGDQGGRLFAEISDLVVVQHCAQITPAVRDLLRAYAVRPGQIKPFCLLDGAETIRVLRAHGKLGFTSRRTIDRGKQSST
ncbi:MAG TPA: hypothetical protein VFW25_06145 [Silvibacterium sp.]|nr:hypothetical protein [Silvibacterium sp.]